MLPFDRLFCGQHFCQKLSKSDDVHFKAIAFNIIGVVFWRHSVDTERWLDSRAVSVLQHSTAWVQIAAATLSGNSLRQTVHTHCASVHQAAKLVAALLRVAGATAGLAESNGSLPPGL